MLAWYNLHILQTLNKEMFNLPSKNSPYCKLAPTTFVSLLLK